MSNEYDHLFKLLIVGDAGTGKTCILQRFANDTFVEAYISTIGVDFANRSITVGGKTVKLQIWDTAGQERFRTITTSYYRGAQGILVVYDVTNRESFQHLQHWQDEIGKYAPAGVHVIVVGNKSDSFNKEVSTEEAYAWAQSRGYEFFEVSTKNNTNIELMFNNCAEALLSRAPEIGIQIGSEERQSLRIEEDLYRPPSQPEGPPVESAIAGVAGLIGQMLSPSLPDSVNKFREKIAPGKTTSCDLGLAIGEFEQTQSALTLRYKTGSEASSIAYDLGISAGSVGIALSLKATDDADSFKLGELSATLKGLLEPLLNTTKSTLDIRVVSEFDGTKIFRMVWEIKDEALCSATKELMSQISATKLDLDLEFSSRPARQSPAEFVFAKLRLDTEFKRGLSFLALKDLAKMINSSDLEFLSAMAMTKRIHVSLAFDSLVEFWSTMADASNGGVKPPYDKVGWHLAEFGLREHLKTHVMGESERQVIEPVYKNFEGIAGLHSLDLVLGGENVIEFKGDNFDIFTLLPTFSEFEELQKEAKAARGW